mmetsp:Transcript_34768/g.53391  ORF Transcript_34768/g.53391 Transcript_34768/m.53391 type:complete len:105 (+) Transcript_34768:634-948(+)
MCEIESTAYDFTKSLLIDSEAMKFRPSVMVAAIITVTLEVHFRLKFDEKKQSTKVIDVSQCKDFPMLIYLKQANQVWDSILQKIFGENSVLHLENFGRYLFLRQ